MQSVQRRQNKLSELQASLDAYLDKHLDFAELRTQWITTLAEQPTIRNSAVRLIYQQPSDRHLADERARALKRIVEAAIHEGDPDWTVELEKNDSAGFSAGEEGTNKTEIKSASLTPVSTEVDPRERFVPGYVLKHRFVLEESLGGGGIGRVFRARDRLRERADAHADMIAVKILRDEYRANPDLLLALQREVVSAQALSHPNIVRVHDFYQDGDIYFLTMELLEGEPLRDLLSRLHPATVPSELATELIAGMCRGLLHAHAHGLVHADFKPGNVFLTTDNEPKIFDLGSAAIALPDNRQGHSHVSSDGRGIRSVTPAYSSCNRLEGGPPCFSDDVYSLSCVIYELVAGRHPYGRKSALVARELDLRPERVEGLTDLQWRTLASGLMPSREDRATEIHDLQEAFSHHEPAVSPSPPEPAKRSYAGTVAAILAGFALGAGSLYATSKFDFSWISSGRVSPETPAQPVTGDTAMVDDATGELDAAGTAAIQTANADNADDPELVQAPADSPASNASSASTSSPAPDMQSSPPVAPGFQLNASEFRVLESSTAVAVEINRQGDVSEPASVHWTTFAGSADPQLDYGSFFRRIVHFGAGEETKTIFIPIVSDTSIESDEKFEVALGVPDGEIELVQPYSATVTIIDDDF